MARYTRCRGRSRSQSRCRRQRPRSHRRSRRCCQRRTRRGADPASPQALEYSLGLNVCTKTSNAWCSHPIVDSGGGVLEFSGSTPSGAKSTTLYLSTGPSLLPRNPAYPARQGALTVRRMITREVTGWAFWESSLQVMTPSAPSSSFPFLPGQRIGLNFHRAKASS